MPVLLFLHTALMIRICYHHYFHVAVGQNPRYLFLDIYPPLVEFLNIFFDVQGGTVGVWTHRPVRFGRIFAAHVPAAGGLCQRRGFHRAIAHQQSGENLGENLLLSVSHPGEPGKLHEAPVGSQEGRTPPCCEGEVDGRWTSSSETGESEKGE